MEATSIEKIIEFLNRNNIKNQWDNEGEGFNRVIEFEIEGVKYFIEWWVNQSYLKLKNEFSSPSLAFKYIDVNPNSPTTKHSLQLCFFDKAEPFTDWLTYRAIPFGALKIPFNNSKKSTSQG